MERIVILTGAGISAESGLGTFRDKDGLWSQVDLGAVATPQGFAADRARVHAFYNARRARARAAVPNAAHLALARLQDLWPGPVCLITQNVDDLHERAGSRDVIHMHGRLTGALCAACGARWEAPDVMHADDPCPECGATSVRPDVVWFGEMPYRMEEIAVMLARADLFAAIGTSGTVYPAAGFVSDARRAHTIELNAEPSDVAELFDELRLGPATVTVPAWVDEVLAARPAV